MTKESRKKAAISAGLRFWGTGRTGKNETPLQILKFQKIDFHLRILQ